MLNRGFRHLGEGQQPSASEYNRLADAVNSLLQSTDVQYFKDSTGVHVRRQPVGSLAGDVRIAYVKTFPGAGTDVDCYLDIDITGEDVTVTCNISNGSNLNQAMPMLAPGDIIIVTRLDDTWYCTALFNGAKFRSG